MNSTSRRPHNQHHVSVICRTGQARIIEDHANSGTEQAGRRHSRGVAAKKNGLSPKPAPSPSTNLGGSPQIDTSRENVVHHWIQSCQALTTWEKNGGRTINWSISTALAQHYHLDSIIVGWNLTADPLCPSFHPVGCPIPAGTRALVPLYQYNEEDTPMSWFTSSESMWVAMVYPTQL